MSDEIKNKALWNNFKKNNNQEARNKLIVKNLNLVKYRAGRLNMLLPNFIEKEDLESSGIIGLMEAVENFNPDLGYKFKTFAQKRIKGAMLDYLRELDWLPTSFRRDGKKIKQAARDLSQKLGRKPTKKELADAVDLPEETVNKIYQKLDSSNWISLYGEVGDSKILDFLQGDSQKSPENSFNRKEKLKILTGAIEKLPEKEKLVISLYYYDELTQKEIAEILKLSPARISQVHKKAVQRLRGLLSRKKEELLEV